MKISARRASLAALVAAFGLHNAVACQPPPAEDHAEKDKPAATTETPKTTPQKRPEPPKMEDIPAPTDVAAAPADAVKSPTGLASRVLKPGTGIKPGPTDIVEVHYTGWTPDGKMFDSSKARNRTAKFPLNGVIKGWTEGVQLMSEGEERRFWIPADLAYGEKPARPGAPAGPLVFDVELIKVVAMPKTPEDVAAVPKTATKTKSGLAYRALTTSGNGQKPAATDTVEVHYAGWTLDGKMFDTSYKRGQSTSFPLDGVIKGWTEGVQLMSVGDKFRFWIPADLAYGETPARPGAPAGMLVFDIELLSIKK